MLQIFFSLVTLLGASTSPASLNGKVVGPDGAEVTGATVTVYSATPKEHTTPRNSLDLARLREVALSTAFKIENVDLDMKYDVLVQADGYRPLALHTPGP